MNIQTTEEPKIKVIEYDVLDQTVGMAALVVGFTLPGYELVSMERGELKATVTYRKL